MGQTMSRQLFTFILPPMIGKLIFKFLDFKNSILKLF
jgi:hypothetical protein